MNSPNASLAGALLGLLAFGLYAGYDIAIKIIGPALNPLQIVFCAASFALPMFLGQLLATGQARALWPVLPGWTLARVLVSLLNAGLGAYAFSILPLAQAYAVFFLMPLMIAALAWPLLGEPLDAARGAAILAGLLGVAIALQPGAAVLGWGHLSALAAAALGACNYVIIRKTGRIERPGVILIYPMAAQVLALGALMPWLWAPMRWPDLALTFLMALALFCGGFAIVAAYRRAAAVVVAPMQYSQILWAALLGWLIFGERIGPATWLGILIIIGAGLFLLSRTDPDPVTSAAEAKAG